MRVNSFAMNDIMKMVTFSINTEVFSIRLEWLPKGSMLKEMYEGDKEAELYSLSNEKFSRDNVLLIIDIITRNVEREMLKPDDLDWKGMKLLINYLCLDSYADYIYPLFLSKKDRIDWYESCDLRRCFRENAELVEIELEDMNKRCPDYDIVGESSLGAVYKRRVRPDIYLDSISHIPRLFVAGGYALSKFTNYTTSYEDIDIFAYGPNSLEHIIEASKILLNMISDNDDDVIFNCDRNMHIRTKYSITIIIYNIKFQFILIESRTPYEILNRFDIDSCCIGFILKPESLVLWVDDNVLVEEEKGSCGDGVVAVSYDDETNADDNMCKVCLVSNGTMNDKCKICFGSDDTKLDDVYDSNMINLRQEWIGGQTYDELFDEALKNNNDNTVGDENIVNDDTVAVDNETITNQVVIDEMIFNGTVAVDNETITNQVVIDEMIFNGTVAIDNETITNQVVIDEMIFNGTVAVDNETITNQVVIDEMIFNGTVAIDNEMITDEMLFNNLLSLKCDDCMNDDSDKSDDKNCGCDNCIDIDDVKHNGCDNCEDCFKCHRCRKCVIRENIFYEDRVDKKVVDTVSYERINTKFLALPRFIRAFETKTNTIDPTRQSPTYTRRLIKYFDRGFAIAIPGFTRNNLKLPSSLLLAMCESSTQPKQMVNIRNMKLKGLILLIVSAILKKNMTGVISSSDYMCVAPEYIMCILEILAEKNRPSNHIKEILSFVVGDIMNESTFEFMIMSHHDTVGVYTYETSIPKIELMVDECYNEMSGSIHQIKDSFYDSYYNI